MGRKKLWQTEVRTKKCHEIHCYNKECSYPAITLCICKLDQLFHRVMVLSKRTDDFKKCLNHKSCPYEPSLFENCTLMQKSCKSDFTKVMTCNIVSLEDMPSSLYTVVDGGHFFHLILWSKMSSFKEIVNLYVNFALRWYNRLITTIIFYSYLEYAATKVLEQICRSKIISASMNFTLYMQCVKLQSEFLANTHNKKKVILLVCEKRKIAGINTLTVQSDADRNIVTTGSCHPTIIRVRMDFQVVVMAGRE